MNILRSIWVCCCLAANVLFAQNAGDFTLTTPEKLPGTKSELWATQYFIHQMRSGGAIPFCDANGLPTGLSADTCDFCTAALEGTAYVTDTAGNVVVLNFARTGDSAYVNCRKCKRYATSGLKVESWGRTQWTISSGFGDGVKNYRLVPFRTIAVDPAKIPYGTVLYIPKARGASITLPDGRTLQHDGYFFAGDTGGAIKQSHIDIFTGVSEGNPFGEVIFSNPEKTFDAYIVSDPAIAAALRELHVK